MLLKKNIMLTAVFFIILIVLITGCSKTHTADCNSTVRSPVTDVSVPDTGFTNQNIDISISCETTNGCGKSFDVTEENNSDTIIFRTLVKYQGCICTQIAGTFQASYLFKRSMPGTYYLKFEQADNVYLFDTLVLR